MAAGLAAGYLAWPAALTIELAAITTHVILLVVGTPVAWWLARSRAWWKEGIGTIVALPLVLPPTVLGFYLLVLLGPSGPGGAIAGLWASAEAGLHLPGAGDRLGALFDAVCGAADPQRVCCQGDRPLEVAATLRASPVCASWIVAVPLARPGFLPAAVLGFAHTVGEFGVVLMIGGYISGVTKVLSVAIYDDVETMQWWNAQYSGRRHGRCSPSL